MTAGEILRAFEDGSFPKEQWTHAAHLRVAGCSGCVSGSRSARSDAGRRAPLKRGLGRQEHGRQRVYHETITCFRIAVAAAFLAALPEPLTHAVRIQALVDEFASRRDLFREYYSFDVVKSREARANWVAPDLKPLPRNNPNPARV